MDRATETRAKPLALAVLAVMSLVLAGCEEALETGNEATEASSDSTQNSAKREIFPEATGNPRDDVEAPEVFALTEAGLWDGRPSLGGIWIAHPDVTQPERVRIKNTANNKTVTGALFRRERNLPGPALQLSSDAAVKLGILAGSPTRVEVVALRRKPVEPAPKAEPETTPEPEVADPVAADAPAEDQTAEAEEKPKRKWWQKKETAAVAAAGTAAVAADAAAETTTEVAETAVEAAPEVATSTLSDPEVTPPADASTKKKWWQKKSSDEITQTSLDPIEGAAAAIEASEPTPPTAAASAESDTASVSKPYVQVGTFSVEENAESAARKIRRNGLTTEVRELKTGEKSVWRVLVGPAKTRGERTALQRDVKDLGFTDAFVVKN
jgi:cell division septation protein DedD